MLTSRTGPAHAVYFATYEVVKQAMGGNASGHHPVAAGKQINRIHHRMFLREKSASHPQFPSLFLLIPEKPTAIPANAPAAIFAASEKLGGRDS
jgi:hypothetical protein